MDSKYELKWEHSKTYRGKKQYSVSCKLQGHPTIKSFKIGVRESDDSNNLEYDFSVTTIMVHVDGPNKNNKYYDGDATRDIKEKVLSSFTPLKISINHSADPDGFRLFSFATKEQTLACTEVICKVANISHIDTTNIINFVQTGIFSDKQVMEKIIAQVDQQKIQEAFDEAGELEEQGYKGIMFRLANHLLARGHMQPAYLSFSEVPERDEKYKESQLAAAKLAADSNVSFDERINRSETIFNHFKNAGAEGRFHIDKLFERYIGVKVKVVGADVKVKVVGTDFETVAKLSEAIADLNVESKQTDSKPPRP